MKRGVKWAVGVTGALVVVAAAAALVGTQLAERKSQRHVSVKLQPVTWASTVAALDAATLARGKYLFNSRGCAECHGVNGAGREFINDGKGLRLKSPNISPGEGSVVARYPDADAFVAMLRSGKRQAARWHGRQRDAFRVAARTRRCRCESGLRLPQDLARPALRPALIGGLPRDGGG